MQRAYTTRIMARDMAWGSCQARSYIYSKYFSLIVLHIAQRFVFAILAYKGFCLVYRATLKGIRPGVTLIRFTLKDDWPSKAILLHFNLQFLTMFPNLYISMHALGFTPQFSSHLFHFLSWKCLCNEISYHFTWLHSENCSENGNDHRGLVKFKILIKDGMLPNPIAIQVCNTSWACASQLARSHSALLVEIGSSKFFSTDKVQASVVHISSWVWLPYVNTVREIHIYFRSKYASKLSFN
jgi:hypothetical protein